MFGYGVRLFHKYAIAIRPCVHYSSEIKAMQKILNKSKKKRRMFMSSPNATYLPKPKEIADTSGESSITGRRRTIVLNKLFMKHITDQMATGEVSDLIYGRSIEISKVKVSPEYNLINVYWFSKATVYDPETEKVLVKVGRILRHELTQLRVIGVVPEIVFVRDKAHAKLMEIDEQLAKADFGEDFTPTDQSVFLKTEFMLNTKLDPSITQEIEKLEEAFVVEDEPIPPMRNVVFGLDRDAIAANIMKRAKQPAVDESRPYGLRAMAMYSIEPYTNREKFRSFLKDRIILQKQLKKSLKHEIMEKTTIGMDENDESKLYESCSDDDENYEFDDFEDENGFLNEISKSSENE